MFLTSAPQTFERMLEAIEDQDWADVKHCSHWLQGGAARILDPSLQYSLQKIERACAGPKPVIPRPELDYLRSAFEAAYKTARTWLNKKPRHASV
jgi:hypothetical protein